MGMPDSVNLTRMVTVSNGSSRIKIVEKEYKGGEPYYHSRIVEALRRENEELKAKLDGILDIIDKQHTASLSLCDKLDKAKWQPIESAPYDKVILVGSKKYGTYVVSKTTKNYPLVEDYPFHTYTGGIMISKEKATHWMPLPDAPEQR